MKSSFVIILTGRILQVIISFLSIKVITNYLSPTNVAYYFLVLSIYNYFGLSLIGPVGQYLNRMIHAWKEENLLITNLINHTIFVFTISLLAIPLSYAYSKFTGTFPDVNLTLLSLLIGVGIFVNTLTTTFVPTLNLLGNRVSFVVLNTFWLLLSLIFSVGLVTINGDSVLNWFSGQAMAQALISIISFAYLKRVINSTYSFTDFLNLKRAPLKKVFDFAFPLAISSALLWLTTDAYRFILERTHGIKFLALFSVGFTIAQKFSYATESIAQQLFFPHFYQAINSKDKDRQKKAWLTMFYSSLPLYLATAIFTSVFCTLLVKVFTGPEYYSATLFVIYGSIFNFFRKLTALFGMAAHAEMKTKLLIIPYSVSAIFSTLVLFAFGGGKHMPGVILSIGAAMSFIIMLYKTWPIIKFKWNNKEAFEAIRTQFK